MIYQSMDIELPESSTWITRGGPNPSLYIHPIQSKQTTSRPTTQPRRPFEEPWRHRSLFTAEIVYVTETEHCAPRPRRPPMSSAMEGGIRTHFISFARGRYITWRSKVLFVAVDPRVEECFFSRNNGFYLGCAFVFVSTVLTTIFGNPLRRWLLTTALERRNCFYVSLETIVVHLPAGT